MNADESALGGGIEMRGLRLLSGTSAIAVTLATSVGAQAATPADDGTAAREVVVTALKTIQSLETVAVTAEVVSAPAPQRRNITEIRDPQLALSLNSDAGRRVSLLAKNLTDDRPIDFGSNITAGGPPTPAARGTIEPPRTFALQVSFFH
jgi:hypothetical protein